MTDGLLKNKLDGLLGKEILVVMDDDIVSLGMLEEFDEKILVLKNVYQAPSKKIDWKRVRSTSKEKKVGFMDWSEVNLEEVYVMIEHITRIWKWGKMKKVKKTDGKVKKPIYYEKEYL